MADPSERVNILGKTDSLAECSEEEFEFDVDLEAYAERIESLTREIADECATVNPQAAAAFGAGLAAHLDCLREMAVERFLSEAERCESEIERTMFAALLFLETGYGTRRDFLVNLDHIDDEKLLIPQYVVGPYRVDFALFVKPVAPGPTMKLVVECDGHDFHDRTKAQAARDKNRDRVLAAHGFQVLRFTGSEIYRDVKACVTQIEAVIDARNEELIKLISASGA